MGGLFYQNPTGPATCFASLIEQGYKAHAAPPGLRPVERAAPYILSYQRATATRTLRAELYYKDYQNLVRFDGS